MSTDLKSAFNLFFNAGCSFFVGAVIVWCVIKLFRVPQSRWKLGLYLLPFIKIVWDVVYRGIPSSSIIHSGIDPLSLPPKSQILSIGAGFSEFGPVLNLVFLSQALDGTQYSTSFADYLYSWVGRHFGSSVPFFLFACAALVSAALLIRRFCHVIEFERARRKQRKFDRSLERIQVGFRSIDVYASVHHEGTPFTGGVFSPYICFPEKTLQQLSPEERKAVTDHEVSHVRQWDLVGTFLVQILGDLFWFVPGYRLLSRRIDRLREVLADDHAIQSGAQPAFLASALLRLEGTAASESNATLYSAFLREKSLLKERVMRLAGTSRQISSRFGWQYAWVRPLIVFFTAAAVLFSTLGENHEVRPVELSSWADLLPRRISGLLEGGGS